MNKKKGIALIQVLLITALLTVFALFLNQGAQRHIHIASLAKQKAEAEVLMHSAKNKLLYTLLTESLQYPTESDIIENEGSNKKEIKKQWNFHNQLFYMSKYTSVKIQDQAGLINVNGMQSRQMEELLTTNGVSPKRAKQIIDTLLDWLDADNIPRDFGRDSFLLNDIRNGQITDITEIEKALPLTSEEQKLLYNNLSIFSRGDLNVMSASKEFLASVTSPGKADYVTQLRSQGKLTVSKFKEFTGIGTVEGFRFIPSNRLAIRIYIDYQDISLSKEFIVKLSPYAKDPILPYDLLLERN
ncbi:type II secretion system protein GspK [Pseudoalteromonas sp. TB64]|uniref:general secretion pathway protein GspK n=1 Tax=Pseudoalteromonas sp. TB64 TaxID=1938600 RepID=UPI000411F2A7|nr:type II secretion system protein GspK [Pseudoalteromonas sp. TB64]